MGQTAQLVINFKFHCECYRLAPKYHILCGRFLHIKYSSPPRTSASHVWYTYLLRKQNNAYSCLLIYPYNLHCCLLLYPVLRMFAELIVHAAKSRINGSHLYDSEGKRLIGNCQQPFQTARLRCDFRRGFCSSEANECCAYYSSSPDRIPGGTVGYTQQAPFYAKLSGMAVCVDPRR